MEDDKHVPLSDNDRNMAGRFGGAEKSPEVKDDDDDSDTEDTSSEKRTPKRSLFLGKEAGEAPKEDTADKQERAGIFGKFLKEKVVEPVEVIEPEEAPTEVEETENAVETEGELTGDFQEIVIDRLQEVEQELELPKLVEFPEAVEADAEFLGRVGERLDEGMLPQEAIEDALEDEFLLPETDATLADLNSPENFEIEEEEETAQVVVQPPSPPAPPIPPVAPPNPPNGNNGGGGVRPPVPPSPPIPPNPGGGPANPNVPNPFNPNTVPLPVNPNVTPIPTSPNVVQDPNTVPMNEFYYRKRRSGDVLLGGAVGYLLGRRRGRKGAEARLEPEISKLDKELNDLKSKLSESEAEVRSMASERVEDTPRVEAVSAIERAPAPLPEIPVTETIAEERRDIEAQEKAFVERLEIVPAEVPQVEKVSEILERTVTETVPTVEKIEINRPVAAEVEPKKDVRTMTMPELLEVADSIYLENTSLRQLYERQRIDAVNLRRVVIEYMQGGQGYERILHKSLEAVEMQRELRNEAKQDDPMYQAHISNDGQADSSQTSQQPQPVEASSVEAGTTQTEHDTTQAKSIINETEDDRALFSNGTAIALGILAGIVITILVLLYSHLF